MKVSIFIPCFIDQIYPEVGVSMVQLLRKLGCEPKYILNQTCCGQPAFNAGLWEESRAVAQKFITDFEQEELIVCPSSSCVGFIRNYYQDLFEESSSYEQYLSIKNKIFELSDFLTNVLGKPLPKVHFPHKIVYHDSCAALRECKIKEAPRKLLDQISGLEVLESDEAAVCCGFGGTFSIKFEPISVAMAEQKVEAALELGADYIVSADQSCLMHLDGYIQAQKLPIKTIHLAELLCGKD